MHNLATTPTNAIVVVPSVVAVVVAVMLANAISDIAIIVGGGDLPLAEEKYELRKFVMLEPDERVTV